MSAGRTPFSHVPHGDFLARAADLEGDEIALFTIAFFLMLERRGPIGDDMAWLGRRAGISTRRANQIRTKLIDQGKWVHRGEMIGDPAALAIVARANARSATNSSNVMKRWERAGQPELALDDENDGTAPQKRRKSAKPAHTTVSRPAEPEAEIQTGGKNAEKTEIIGRKNELKVPLDSEEIEQNQPHPPEIRMSDSHARATPELELDNQTTDSLPDPAPEPRLDDQPIEAQLAACCTAAGFEPRQQRDADRAVKNAVAQVERWRSDGISFDLIVIPTIRSIMAQTDDPTSSLYRFDRHVRTAHARITATPPPRKPNGARPPDPAARFEFEDEDEKFAAFRRDLCDALGPTNYVRLAHSVRFQQIDNRPIVRVNVAPGGFGNADHRLKDYDLSALTLTARRHGFTSVW